MCYSVNMDTQNPYKDTHERLEQLLEDNNRLLRENNTILARMQRNARLAFMFRLIWIVILISVPIILYFYFLAPLIESLESIPTMEGGQFNFQIDELQELLNYFQ